MIPIETGPPRPAGPPFVRDGFRPFFFGACAWAVFAMAEWLYAYTNGGTSPRAEILGMQWHAHEMIFGFSAAVIAGFLLTAVRNWTGRPTLSGRPLMALFATWLVARLAFAVGGTPVVLPAAADLLFGFGLLGAVLLPIRAAGQMGKQAGILSKVATLAVANALFYAGMAGWLAPGVRWGLYLGLYSVVGLVLAIGRRILPNFIAVGTGSQAPLRNDVRIDRAALALFFVFMVAAVFFEAVVVTAVTAGLLALVHAVRMAGWHSAGIWKRPLLWAPYLSYGFLVSGFALMALASLVPLPPFVGLHALAAGGIGLIAVGMMARVSLGHTGRGIATLPPFTTSAFSLVLAAAVVRVAFPMVAPSLAMAWIVTSQSLWILGFAILGLRFAPIWFGPPAR